MPRPAERKRFPLVPRKRGTSSNPSAYRDDPVTPSRRNANTTGLSSAA
ncbi:MAG: hypothetical protein ABIZ70_04760 [Gemmatimonadales bacterium]